MKWFREAKKFTLSREVVKTKINPALDNVHDILFHYLEQGSLQDKFFMGPAIKDEYIRLLKEEIDYFEDAFDIEYETIKKEYEESSSKEHK